MRRSIAALFVTAGVLVLVVGRPGKGLQNQAPAPDQTRAVTLQLGVKDASPARWDGSVALSAGSIVKIRGHHFTDKDKVSDDFTWQAATTEWPTAAGGLHPHEMPDPYSTRVSTVGVTVYYRAPEDAVMRVKTAPGEFEFRLADVPESAPLELLASRVLVSRVPVPEQITGYDYEDDYPSVAVDKSGTPWVAWAGYRNEADEIFVKRAGAEPMKVSEKPGDLFGTSIAVDGRGRVWVVWSERQNTDWHLMARSYDGKSWSRVEPLTTGRGNNLFHRLTADSKGNLHLVWQAFRGGRSDVFLKSLAPGSLADARWSSEINLSDPKRDGRANDWNPSVAADRSGTVWVAWDSYGGGHYNVQLRPVRGGKAGELIRVTDSPRFHAHPSLAVDDRDRLWVAYDEAEENWGKDTGFLLTGGAGLYQSRRIRIAVYAGGKWFEPRRDLNEAVPLGMRRYVQTPKLVAGDKGRMWAFFRPRTSTMLPQSLWAAGGKWEVLGSYYSGDRWSAPITMPESVGRNEGPFDAAAGSDGRAWLAWVTDRRLYGGPNFGQLPQNNDILVAPVSSQAALPPPELGPRSAEPPAALPSEPREKAQVAAVRGYTISAAGKTYKIYRGDMHRHTEISLDGAGDGSLFDAYRYMLDAAGMDYFAVTDHQSGNNQEYTWWRIEKSEDMFHVSGFFTPLFGYERSVAYPNGHRNLVFARRGIRTLPIAPGEPKDHTGPILYPYLRKNNGIAMSHTSHTGMGTDWRDNDPELEPVVEIFQGARTSTEHEGAPLAPSEKRSDLWAGGYRPLGFVWNAWAKGYKLGVQASSDHTSTHTSYACLIAENFTREGLLDAIRRRHSYASTSNIILDFRIEDGAGTHIQGDAFASRSAPVLIVKAFGTGPIEKIDVVRDNQYIHSRPGSAESVEFEYKDASAAPGEHYYYVRVQQKDRNMAWSSPIWVSVAQ